MSFAPARALISVSDKTGIVEFAQGLHALHIEIISTGGTYAHLKSRGIPVKTVESLTDFPELLDGRLKTLHPLIHGGILARRTLDHDAILTYALPLIDLVVVNLYPFAATIQRPETTLSMAIEQIDIGGPTMIRAAAKNHADVAVVVDPMQYPALLESLQTPEGLSLITRQALALTAFEHTAHYDSMIATYLRSKIAPQNFPQQLTWPLTKVLPLRYGENPHQSAAFYGDSMEKTGLAAMVAHQGKPLSFNNLADTNAAITALMALPMDRPACVIVKHENPAGVAQGETLAAAYQRAWACDAISAFGGIIALNQAIEADLMTHILKQQFVEVIAAPSFTPEALAVAESKPLVRLLTIPKDFTKVHHRTWDMKRVAGGLLVQQWDTPIAIEMRCVSEKKVPANEIADAEFAWAVCQNVKSNAIVFVRDGQTLGIGAGQMSRITSVDIAIQKAKEAGFSLDGAVMASDAFLPFTDTLLRAVAAGITLIVQPGGSKKDAEVIAAADAQGVAMVFTGTRHFKH